MSTINQKFKTGIENKDWTLIIEAYESLTGTKIVVKRDDDSFAMRKDNGGKASSPRQNTARPVENDDNDDIIESNRVEGHLEDFINSKRFNMFVDDGTDAVKDKLGGSDRDIQLRDITSRKRPEFKKAKADCSRCNKKFEVHPDEIRGYVCNKCSRLGEFK